LHDPWECGARCAAVNEVAFFWRPTGLYLFIPERAQSGMLVRNIKTSDPFCVCDWVRPGQKRVALWHIGVQGALLLDYFLLRSSVNEQPAQSAGAPHR
jgi:hypothetical protein